MPQHDTNSLLQFFLGERIKELTALHKTARLLQDDTRPIAELLSEVVNLLPSAWQYPEVTAARITVNGLSVMTANFKVTAWMQTAEIVARKGQSGLIEVCYLQERPRGAEGPFLVEERELLDSLAEMLRSYLQHRTAMEEIKHAYDDLERLVQDRTLELRQTNAVLQQQITEHERAQREIEAYQCQLRKLAADLSLTEARERRAIASDLHDHIGQALAFIRMKISGFQGEAMFCGFEQSISEILTLLDQTIQYTRTLTFEISPPILYELGLGASLEWLGEQFTKKHGLRVDVVSATPLGKLPEQVELFAFKSVQELLANALKHAHAQCVRVTLRRTANRLDAIVEDDGDGFDATRTTIDSSNGGFGLFSIRERLMHLGGFIQIKSTPGQGARVTISIPLK